MNRPILLILALAHVADQLMSAVPAWTTLGEELASLLLRLDKEPESANLGRDADALLAKLIDCPSTAVLARTVAENVNADVKRVAVRGVAGAGASTKGRLGSDEYDGYIAVPVFYGTDRAMREDESSAWRYTGERGEPGFGIARVSIPANHRIAELEGPTWWKLEFRPDSKKHVALMEASPCDNTVFVTQLTASLEVADARAVLLFLHGYNVSFEDAVRRAAQLAFDLKFPGRVLVYSWPSEGRTVRYLVDSVNVEWTKPHFEEFLRLALTRVNAQTVDVIAHSMGNRALVRTLEHFDTSALSPGCARLRQIVFAAPDVDADVFRGLAAAVASRAERCTLYASRNDKALLASKILQHYPRAGDANDLVVVPPIDTVDASTVDTNLLSLSHSIFSDKRSILNDIFTLIQQGAPPEKRFDMKPARCAAGPYWKYRP